MQQSISSVASVEIPFFPLHHQSFDQLGINYDQGILQRQQQQQQQQQRQQQQQHGQLMAHTHFAQQQDQVQDLASGSHARDSTGSLQAPSPDSGILQSLLEPDPIRESPSQLHSPDIGAIQEAGAPSSLREHQQHLFPALRKQRMSGLQEHQLMQQQPSNVYDFHSYTDGFAFPQRQQALINCHHSEDNASEPKEHPAMGSDNV